MNIILVFITSLLSLSVHAESTANIRDGVILYGYDPVSYFEAPKPLKGSSQFFTVDNGLKYLFANKQNKEKFDAQPEKFRPAYEGWCATAVASGYKFDIEPTNFKITNGRLFVFYKGWRGDAKKDWLKNESEQIVKADKQWPTVRQSKE